MLISKLYGPFPLSVSHLVALSSPYDVTDRAAYGLRTTLIAYVLLHIPLPETLKEHAPDDLGRIMAWLECQRS